MLSLHYHYPPSGRAAICGEPHGAAAPHHGHRDHRRQPQLRQRQRSHHQAQEDVNFRANLAKVILSVCDCMYPGKVKSITPASSSSREKFELIANLNSIVFPSR